MPTPYSCSNCGASLKWQFYWNPQLVRCSRCGVALDRGRVAEAVGEVVAYCGLYAGLGLGIIGGLVAAIGFDRYFGGPRGVSGWTLIGVWVGVGLALWAACFIWHAQRARRALGGQGSLFRILALWLTVALGIPGATVAFFVAVYFAWDAIAPWLERQGLDADTLSWLVLLSGAGIVLVGVIGLLFYRLIQRALGGVNKRGRQ